MIRKYKLGIPVISDALWIPSELKELCNGFTEKFAIVQAERGAGKTAVIARMALDSRKNVFWYSLDATDNDREILGEYADKLFQQLPLYEEPYLVLDNVQELTSPEVWQMILSGLLHENSGLRIIFITCGEIPRELMPLLLAGYGRLIEKDVFRLSSPEAEAWLAEKYGVEKELAEAAAQDMCGWALGIACVLRALRGENKISVPLDWEDVLNGSGLSKYLDEMIWNTYEKEEQKLLIQTAVLGQFSWELCQKILPENASESTYQRLLQRGTFLHRQSGGQEYEYGRMFRTYLLKRAGGADKKEVCRNAAAYFLEQKNYCQMVHYAMLGEQEEMLSGCLDRHGDELLRTDRGTLGSIIKWLEEKAVTLTPEGCGIAAQYYYSLGTYKRMEWYLNTADSAFGKENKFGCYRSLYRGLLKYSEAAERYEKQIRHVLFLLRESGLPLPYLQKEERELLRQITIQDEQGRTGQDKQLLVQSFGSFRVTVCEDGRELPWRTRKGSELFAYLMDLQGKAVGRSKLLDVLWKEEMPANAVSMLHNMIYNIRRELSDYRLEGMLSYEDKKYRIRMDCMEWDGSRIGQLTELVEQKNIPALRQVWQEFLTYWGCYLEDMDNDWVREKQNYYDEIYKKGCMLLAKQFEEESDYAVASEYYQNILKLDPYSEEAAAGMLCAYGEQREWKKAKQFYEEFCRLLQQDLGLEPDGELVQVYHSYLN
ncbi:MAG: hypothetical protein J1F02_01810 [Lachnospiraceae bacterium]|nr:hypothetical protein [Lachnospiraceae bacterium]